MASPLLKTLEATLVEPTAHKERKLDSLLETYRAALRDAFEANCASMSATNEIVTGYDLPYQAKDALKRYVPQIAGANEIHEDHPVRLVNRAAKFDRDCSREFEFCWNVPQPGRGTNFWIPLRINPEQRDLWDALLERDASPGELRLTKHEERWTLHVTVERTIDVASIQSRRTPVGIDIGESQLVTGCALENGNPERPLIISGSRARQLRKKLHTTLKRLQKREVSTWRIEYQLESFQRALTDIVEKASREVVEYARTFDRPVVVLEDLTHLRERVNYGEFMNRRLHSWAFARLQSRIENKATESGIPVSYVRPEYTSQTCHECGHLGRRPHQGTFCCTNQRCWITEYQADLNAAINIARRNDPWGETCRIDIDGNDSPRDGSSRDTAEANGR